MKINNIWKLKYDTLKRNCKSRGKVFNLSFDDYMTLISDAGLQSPDQIGRSSGMYQMGRIGDTGPYELGNCRYIPFEQNASEALYNNRTSKNPDIRGRVAKRFFITTPSGDQIFTHSVSEFCELNNLSQGTMSMMLRGEIDSYKGYTGSYIN